VGVWGLMFVRLPIEIWGVDRVALKEEVGSGVDEWGKQCGGYWFLLSFCVFGCISVVVEGACVRDCRGLGFCKVGIVGWSAGHECVGGSDSLVTSWGRMGGEGEGSVREWLRRGRMSCWGGYQWILA
jgi:hypothetical protein